MENKRLLMIVNPCSGKAKMKTALLRIVQIFSNADYDVAVYPTKARGDATDYVKGLKPDLYERIIVCGGDGTLNEVVTGLMSAGLSYKIGYIPSGTLNEWSSSIHISRNIYTAAEDIIDGTEIKLDLGQFGEKYFCYTASFGAFTSASYSAPQNIKNILGQAAYFFEGIKSLANIKSVHLKFKADDREIEGDFLFGAISNSMSVGGVVKFDQALVKLNDGLFEVVLIRKPANILKFQSYIDAILKHDLNREGIEFFHTKEITIMGSKEVPWTLDGEYAEGTDTITIKNLPGALRLILPKDAGEKSVAQLEGSLTDDNTNE